MGHSSLQIAATQSISGTGALRIATGFLSQFYAASKEIWISDPTWGNHIPLAESSGLTVKRYRWAVLGRASE